MSLAGLAAARQEPVLPTMSSRAPSSDPPLTAAQRRWEWGRDSAVPAPHPWLSGWPQPTPGLCKGQAAGLPMEHTHPPHEGSCRVPWGAQNTQGLGG